MDRNFEETSTIQGEQFQTIEKQYVYEKNGKRITIKRKYVNKQNRTLKNNELDEFFKNNAEDLKSRKTLKTILDPYNNNHAPVSYAKFYSKFKTVFGYRKNHKNHQTQNVRQNENLTTNQNETNEN